MKYRSSSNLSCRWLHKMLPIFLNIPNRATILFSTQTQWTTCYLWDYGCNGVRRGKNTWSEFQQNQWWDFCLKCLFCVASKNEKIKKATLNLYFVNNCSFQSIARERRSKLSSVVDLFLFKRDNEKFRTFSCYCNGKYRRKRCENSFPGITGRCIRLSDLSFWALWWSDGGDVE